MASDEANYDSTAVLIDLLEEDIRDFPARWHLTAEVKDIVPPDVDKLGVKQPPAPYDGRWTNASGRPTRGDFVRLKVARLGKATRGSPGWRLNAGDIFKVLRDEHDGNPYELEPIERFIRKVKQTPSMAPKKWFKEEEVEKVVRSAGHLSVLMSLSEEMAWRHEAFMRGNPLFPELESADSGGPPATTSAPAPATTSPGGGGGGDLTIKEVPTIQKNDDGGGGGTDDLDGIGSGSLAHNMVAQSFGASDSTSSPGGGGTRALVPDASAIMSPVPQQAAASNSRGKPGRRTTTDYNPLSVRREPASRPR
jgi:hypothetical protein